MITLNDLKDQSKKCNDLVQASLNHAHQLRSRYTMLRFWNEHVGVHHYA